MANIIIPQVAIDSNQTLAGLAINAVTKGAKVQADNDNVVYGVSDDKLPMSAAQLVVSVGGDVTDWALWFEIQNKTNEVPSDLPNATYTDEENVEIAHTWETWKKSNHTFYEADDRILIGTNANSGTHLNFSEIISQIDNLVLAKDLPKVNENND